jgi:hypothetical protein
MPDEAGRAAALARAIAPVDDRRTGFRHTHIATVPRSTKTALVYQHAADDRDRLIAERLAAMTAEAGLAPVVPITVAKRARGDEKVREKVR